MPTRQRAADLVSATNPENGTVTYVYDSSHHVTSRTDAIGQKTVYTYDSYGRLSQVQYFDPSNNEYTNQRVTYYYDATYPSSCPFSPANQHGHGTDDRRRLRRRDDRRLSRLLLLLVCL